LRLIVATVKIAIKGHKKLNNKRTCLEVLQFQLNSFG